MTSPLSAPVPDVSVYSDLGALDKLKQGAKAQDPKAIREAARQFESVFARMMLKSMRDANFKDPNFGSDQEDFYQGMFDDQLSVELTKGHGLGLADMLVQQLTRAGLVAPSAPDTGSAKAARPAGSANGAPGANAASGVSAGSGADGAPGADAAAGAASSSTTPQQDFVRTVWPFAQEAGRLLGTDPRNIVAQAALETGWGRSVPTDGAGRSSNNLFGIKAGAQWSGAAVGARTIEFSGAVPTARTDKFRAYGSATESFRDYVNLLAGSPRYAAALNTGSDASAFASALQRGGYSTDPAYAQKVAAIAQNLDVPPPQPAQPGLKSAATGPISPTTTLL